MPDFPYQYEPLSSRQIRLLRVSPQQEGATGLPKCSFLLKNLNDPEPPFCAFSYVWGGTPTFENKVQIEEDGFLYVTDSTASILRDMATEYPGLYCWIDALCINQNDEDEKAVQVNMMFDVFSSAKRTVAWTGDASEDSALGLDFVLQLKSNLDYLSRSKIQITVETISRCTLWWKGTDDWKALGRFLQRPFFTRIWIVQELAAASSDLILKCGNTVLRWETFADVVVAVRNAGAGSLLSENVGNGLPTSLTNLRTVFGLRSNLRANAPLSLDSCLVMSDKFSCSIPRDLIFALKNISADATDEALRPEYRTKSTEDVLFETTAHLILKRKSSLSLLYLAGVGFQRQTTVGSESLPSWVPDFNPHRGATILGAFANDSELSQREGYSCCKSTGHTDSAGVPRISPHPLQNYTITFYKDHLTPDREALPYDRREAQSPTDLKSSGNSTELQAIGISKNSRSLTLKCRIIGRITHIFQTQPKQGTPREEDTRDMHWLQDIFYLFQAGSGGIFR